jgi:hypothetical protein
MSRAPILGATLLSLGIVHGLALAQPALQPDDRGGPAYTTGTTMGRDVSPPPGTSDSHSGSSMAGQPRERTASSARARRRSVPSRTPAVHHRATH